ncbi:MAG: protein kinase [Planctomyces sp.]|nr:protein kinase [Planctomyces sp.]
MNAARFDSLLEEFQFRWLRGQQTPAEDFILEHSERIWTDEERLDVVYAEVLLREQRGQDVILSEYQCRFPELSGDLQIQWEVHTSLKGMLDTTPPGQARTQPASGASVTETTHFPAAPDGYEIISLLGRGGSGVVFLARDTRLQRMAALKYLDSSAADVQEKLEREARVLASVAHPGIVQVYAVGKVGDQFWMAFEYASGGSLRSLVRGRVLDWETATAVMIRTARAAGAAHAHGIVHCDLNPGNLLIAGEPVSPAEESPGSSVLKWLGSADIKVTDFGLARIHDPTASSTTSIEGTFLYMSPEQGRSEKRMIGPATDVYALGATMYELLTGRTPFTGSHAAEILNQIFNDTPARLRDLRSGIPIDLETICLKCLEKDVAQRYSDGNALADDLQRCLDGLPVVARPIGSVERFRRWARRNRRLAIAITTSVVLLILGVCSTTAIAMVASHYRRQSDSEAESASRARSKAEAARGQAEAALELAKTEKQKAEDERTKAEKVAEENLRFADNMVRMIYSADPRIHKRQLTVAEMIVGMTDQSEFWEGLSEAHAFRLRLAFARSLMGAGRSDKSIPLLNHCLVYAEAHLSPGDRQILDIKRDLATQLPNSESDRALELLTEIAHAAEFPEADRNYARLKLAEHRLNREDFEEAESELVALTSNVEASSPVDQLTLFRIRMLRNRIWYSTGRAEQALPECLRIREMIPSGVHAMVALEVDLQIAECYEQLHQPKDAIRVYREVIPKIIDIAGRPHIVTMETVRNLALQMAIAGESEGIREFAGVYSGIAAPISERSIMLLQIYALQMVIESGAGSPLDGTTLMGLVQEMIRRSPPDSRRNLDVLLAVVNCLERNGRFSEAASVCEICLESFKIGTLSAEVRPDLSRQLEEILTRCRSKQ